MISLRHLAVRPKVGKEGKRGTTERFAPGLFGGDWIATDGQDLAIESFELGALRFVGRNLAVSGRRERERVKDDDDVLAPAIFAEFNVKAVDFGLGDHAREREIRRVLADREIL